MQRTKATTKSKALPPPLPQEESPEAEVARRLASQRERYRNKQRTLLLSSRGITSRYRHFMGDLQTMMPHAKKEAKFDGKDDMGELADIAESRNCNNIIFFECRKKQDLYMWVGKSSGPCVKLHVSNVHTMGELRFTGNALKGSRPLLTFDTAFDEAPQLALVKELLAQAFSVPHMHPKSKPFVDHILSFTYLDGRVWLRHYQIAHEYVKERPGQKEEDVLVEIGPRAVLQPVKILAGAFAGACLWENPAFVAPSMVRSRLKAQKQERYVQRLMDKEEREDRMTEYEPPRDQLEGLFDDEEEEEEGEGEEDGMSDNEMGSEEDEDGMDSDE